MPNPALRIGLFGGTVNPPHTTHIALALAAQAQLGLDRVDLMPAGSPWQKAGSTMPSAAHRQAMCQAAIVAQTNAKLGIEAFETHSNTKSYSVNTLRALYAQHPSTRYTFILRADQANQFNTWHEWRALLGLCDWAVVARNQQAASWPAEVGGLMQALNIQPSVITFAASSLSSSQIREHLTAGIRPESLSPELIPLAVAQYIKAHSLYS